MNNLIKQRIIERFGGERKTLASKHKLSTSDLSKIENKTQEICENDLGITLVDTNEYNKMCQLIDLQNWWHERRNNERVS